MEGQRGSFPGEIEQFGAQLVVQSSDLTNGLWTEPFQEPTERTFIRQGLQTKQREEEAVVLKLVGFVDALHARDQQKEKQKKEVNRIELRPLRSSPEDALQTTAQVEALTKTLNQEQSTVVSQCGGFERNLQCLQAFSHAGVA